jgi:hypothetical protein
VVNAVGIHVSGGVDVASNAQTSSSQTNDFDINTLTTPAHVVSVKATPWKVTHSNVGLDTFAVRVEYDKPMDTSIAPTLGFVGDTPALTAATNATLEPDGGSWDGNEVYYAYYNVEDTTAQVSCVCVSVAGAQDTAGYDQARRDPVNYDFAIDMTLFAAVERGAGDDGCVADGSQQSDGQRGVGHADQRVLPASV